MKRIKKILLQYIFMLMSLILFQISCYAKAPLLLAPLFHNIGTYSKKIDANPAAQRYFNQGLIFFYSFEYGESIRSFKAAIRADPNCAMCYWGLALALGSKTDMPLNGNELEEAKIAIQKAAHFVHPHEISERAYIAALSTRYMKLTPERLTAIAGLCSSYSQVNRSNAKNYADEMKKLIALFPEDVDANVLYAAALFDVSQWNFWNDHNKPNPYTFDIINTLISALAINKNHPGANHLYVHVMEFSPDPKKSLANAKRLPKLVPISEHLAHMPCHTYFSLGHYHDATLANQDAIQVYKNYASQCEQQGFPPEIQYLYYHNYDYLIHASSMEGRKKLTIRIANDLAKKSLPFVEKNIFLQKWQTETMLSLARFHEWHAILTLPKPSKSVEYTLGIWYYVRSLAEIKTHQLNAAKKDLTALKLIIQDGPNEESLGILGNQLLKIGENTLEALLAYQDHQSNIMLAKLKKAVALQDSIKNNDPPAWYFPMRELLGNAFLSTKNYPAAKKVFLEDLKQHPNNPWSLYGLYKTSLLLGKKREAEHIKKQYQIAWQYADISHPIFLIT